MQLIQLMRNGYAEIRIRVPREWLKSPQKEAEAKRIIQDKYVDSFVKTIEQARLTSQSLKRNHPNRWRRFRRSAGPRNSGQSTGRYGRVLPRNLRQICSIVDAQIRERNREVGVCLGQHSKYHPG